MLTFQSLRLFPPFGVFYPRRLRKTCQKRRCRPKDDQTDYIEAEDTAREVHDHIDAFEERQTPVYVLQSTVVDPVRPIQYPSWHGHHGNLILAMVILLAAKLGRSTIEQHRLDSYGTQTPMEGIVGVSKELALRRKQQQEAEALMKETEAKKRMESALQKAKEETAKKQERERKYQAEQEQEVKRLQAEQQRQKEAFEEQEKRMQTELEKRMEIERQIQQDLENKRKAEAEEQRRLAAEEDRLERERKAAEVAEKQRQILLQKQQEEAERQALDQLKTKFAVRVESELFIKRSPSGVKTTKPPTQQALVSITLKMKPSISESFTTLEDHFVDLEDTRDSIGKLIGFVCNGTMNEYLSNIRLQSMQGTGPLTLMDDKELELFTCFASLHTHFLNQKFVQKLLDTFESTGSVSSYEDKLQVRTEWGVLPRDHEKSLNLTTESILKQALEKRANAAALKKSFNKLIDSEVQDLCRKHERSKDFTESIFASYLAYIHDRALDFKNSALYESVTPLLQELLTDQCRQSKPDTLQHQSTALSCSLADGNPIIEWFELFSKNNMSPARRQAAKEKQQRLDDIARARILEEQWPDRRQIAAELIKEREEKTPIPERVWAMRNVAKTLLISSSASESALTKAKNLIEDAIQLQREHFDAPDHPGLLGSLKDYADIEARIDVEKAVVVWEKIVQILGAVCDRYRRQGELYSAALCAETAVLNGESFLDVRHPLITKLGKASEALFNVLNEKEKSKLLELRRSRGGLSVVSEAFATQLGVYRVPGKVDRVEQWTQNLDLDPL